MKWLRPVLAFYARENPGVVALLYQERTLNVGIPACTQERKPLRCARSPRKGARVELSVVVEVDELRHLDWDLGLYGVRP